MRSETFPPLLFLESPTSRVPPARAEAHDRSAMEATSVVVSGVLFQRRAPRRRPASALTFIVRAGCQPFLLVVVTTFRKLGQACDVPIALRQRERGSKFSHRPQVVLDDFGRGSEARESSIRQSLLGPEATRGFGIEESTDKALGCGVGCQGLNVR